MTIDEEARTLAGVAMDQPPGDRIVCDVHPDCHGNEAQLLERMQDILRSEDAASYELSVVVRGRIAIQA